MLDVGDIPFTRSQYRSIDSSRGRELEQRGWQLLRNKMQAQFSSSDKIVARLSEEGVCSLSRTTYLCKGSVANANFVSKTYQ